MLKSGKKSLIKNERILQYEDVGFQWIYDNKLIPNTTWNEQISELLYSKQQWGHCDVPHKYAKDSKLNNWEVHRRKEYRLLKSGKKYFIKN